MKNILQPKYIILIVLLIAAFFLLRKEFAEKQDVLIAGDQSNVTCPVHGMKLKLDTVVIVVRKEDPDSASIALKKKYFPFAQDTLFLLEWLHGDEFRDVTHAQLWYCPACRVEKKKYFGM